MYTVYCILHTTHYIIYIIYYILFSLLCCGARGSTTACCGLTYTYSGSSQQLTPLPLCSDTMISDLDVRKHAIWRRHDIHSRFVVLALHVIGIVKPGCIAPQALEVCQSPLCCYATYDAQHPIPCHLRVCLPSKVTARELGSPSFSSNADVS